MKTFLFFVAFLFTFKLSSAQNGHLAPSKPREVKMEADTASSRRKLPTVDPDKTDTLRLDGLNVSNQEGDTKSTLGAIVPKSTIVKTVSGSQTKQSRDVVLVYDFCADERKPALTMVNNTSRMKFLKNGFRQPKFRNWLYLRADDNVRMVIRGINSSKYSLKLNTIGVVTEFDTANFRAQLDGLSTNFGSVITAHTPAPPGLSEETSEERVQNNLTILSNYLIRLREARTKLVESACVSTDEIIGYLDADVPGTSLGRARLLQQQQQLLATISESELKEMALTNLSEIAEELEYWHQLKLSATLIGPVMMSRGKDFARFELVKKYKDDKEEILPLIEIPIYGNFRANISTGFLFTGLMDNSYLAVDESVGTTDTNGQTGEPSASGSKKIPVLDSQGKISIGIGALVHFYKTTKLWKGNLTPALSVGASLNASGRYTFMGGGSLILGTDQRLVLTGGIAIGPVARLQAPFKEGASYEFSGAQFPTTNQTLNSWFFGITYNLSSTRNPVSKN